MVILQLRYRKEEINNGFNNLLGITKNNNIKEA